MQNAVHRSMELCSANGLNLKHNFKRIFKGSPLGIVPDWKLSLLAYNLVRLNGNSSNPNVAKLQISLADIFSQR
jgi:hypothetical protein